MKKVFVDTMIFRYTTDARVSQFADYSEATVRSPNGNTRDINVILHKSKVTEADNTNPSYEAPSLKSLSTLAKDNKIEFVYSHEINIELMSQPLVKIIPGLFYGAPIKMVHSPLLKCSQASFDDQDTSPNPYKDDFHSNTEILSLEITEQTPPAQIEEYLRYHLLTLPISGMGEEIGFRNLMIGMNAYTKNQAKTVKLMLPIFESINIPRYKEILNSLNAASFSEKNRPNVYMDVYHLLTAELSNCNYFLTTDTHILGRYKDDHLVAIKPNELLKELND